MLSGISIWQLLIILAIVIMIFGTKKMRNLGGDLGSAIKNFKSAINDGDKADESAEKTAEKKEEPKPLPTNSTQQQTTADADFDKTKTQDNKTNS
ncbi:MAG: twin-arginine translocase TatA/TatE family subunit [Oceanobacter sp.]